MIRVLSVNRVPRPEDFYVITLLGASPSFAFLARSIPAPASAIADLRNQHPRSVSIARTGN